MKIFIATTIALLSSTFLSGQNYLIDGYKSSINTGYSLVDIQNDRLSIWNIGYTHKGNLSVQAGFGSDKFISVSIGGLVVKQKEGTPVSIGGVAGIQSLRNSRNKSLFFGSSIHTYITTKTISVVPTFAVTFVQPFSTGNSSTRNGNGPVAGAVLAIALKNRLFYIEPSYALVSEDNFFSVTLGILLENTASNSNQTTPIIE